MRRSQLECKYLENYTTEIKATYNKQKHFYNKFCRENLIQIKPDDS